MMYAGTFGLDQFVHRYAISPVPAIAVTSAPVEAPREPSLRPKRVAKATKKPPVEAPEEAAEQDTSDKSFFIEDTIGGIKIKGKDF